MPLIDGIPGSAFAFDLKGNGTLLKPLSLPSDPLELLYPFLGLLGPGLSVTSPSSGSLSGVSCRRLGLRRGSAVLLRFDIVELIILGIKSRVYSTSIIDNLHFLAFVCPMLLDINVGLQCSFRIVLN